MASELRRHGLSCRIIETRREREVWSKAAAIQPRTLEVLRSMGIAERIVELGRRFYGLNVHAQGKRLAHVDIRIPGSPYPFMLGLSQKKTEEVLEDHLASLGVKLERGVELTSFTHGADGVKATLAHDDGHTEDIEVPWLIGCDGAHSFVRKNLDLLFEGESFPRQLIQADIGADFPFEVDPHEGQMFVSEHGPCGFLPLLGEGRYRLIVMEPGEGHDEPTLESFQKIIDQRATGFSVRLHEPAWTAAFRFHGRLVSQYRVGRVFLAGDAAHIHSPVGAQGMNLGIQDAFNLAWKLALVHRGVARRTLLDSYDAERRAIGQSVVNTTDRATNQAVRAMTLRNPIVTSLRNQVVSLVFSSGLLMDRIFAEIGGVNVGYPNSPAVGQFHSSLWRARVTESRESEVPDLGDWVRFQAGPGPGRRVPDITLPSSASSILDLFATSNHTLLLFDGAAATEEGYENLAAIASDVRSQHGGHVDVRIVVPHAERPAPLHWDGDLILDPDFELHDHFGARSESLYLVRPDGYVAYRSQPADAEHLAEYLGALFV